MSRFAALTRYANPAAPVHSDARLELARAFAADLPLIPDSHRAEGLVSDLARMRGVRDMLCDALEDLLTAHARLRGNEDHEVSAARHALELCRLA